jgi:hypothetical protein
MKQLGADEWFIDVILRLFRVIKAGFGSQTTTAVENIIGRKPYLLVNLPKIMLRLSNSCSGFCKDYMAAIHFLILDMR